MGVSVYCYMGVSVYWPLSVLCVFVCVCVISNQSTSKKPHLSGLSKLDALLHKTHIKVFRLDIPTSMISLKKGGLGGGGVSS